MRFFKNLKYWLALLYLDLIFLLDIDLLSNKTFNLTFIIIATCQILLCEYFPDLYNFSSLWIVLFTSSKVEYLM